MSGQTVVKADVSNPVLWRRGPGGSERGMCT